jgi:ubiquinone/menaquinone biosynthesis C-methylase UbiE
MTNNRNTEMNIAYYIKDYYDHIYTLGIWTEERLDPSRIYKKTLTIKNLHLHYGQIILDLGCGTGRYSKIFSLIGMEVIGLDISKVALKLARKHQQNLVLGTAEKLPFREVFDRIFAMDIIEHVLNDLECLKEITRVTKNEGIIFISFPKKKKNFQHNRR